MPTADDLAALRAELAKCHETMTPGEWTACHGSHGDSCICGFVWSKVTDRIVAAVHVERCPKEEHAECSSPDVESKANHNGIAAIRNALPAILAVIDRAIAAEEEVERLAARGRELEDQLVRIANHLGKDARNAPDEDRTIAGLAIATLAAAREQAESLAGALARLEPLLWLNQNPTTADHHEWNAAVLESRAALATYRAGRDAGEGAK